MANSPLPSALGYSVTATSSKQDARDPHLDKTSGSSALRSPEISRLYPPVVQLEQIPSPSLKTPTFLSPNNGPRTGSPSPHLSTPPGPPVFSSPVRPAAVPFRTSPSTPQPVALTSASSLSGSPLAHHSNGSLNSQLSSDVSKDSVLTGEPPYVLFSAHKVLKKKKHANVPSLGFGAMVSAGREVSPGYQLTQRDPHRCQNCGAFSSMYSNILFGSGQWQCVICRKLNGSDSEYIASSKEELSRFPELSSPIVEYVRTANRQPGFIPVSDSRISAPIILVIDECLDDFPLHHMQSSLHSFVDSLAPTTRVGIISYGRMVSVCDFSEEAFASVDMLPGNNSPTEESLKALIYGTGVYLSTIHASLPVAHKIISSFTPYKLNVPESSRDRCLGSAVEVALAIIQGPSPEISQGIIRRPGGNSRVIVCAGGPNTYGPGSVPHSHTHPNYPYMEKSSLNWMEQLGQRAHRQNVVVDIICAGTCPVRVPILQPLAKASGGVLIIYDDFGETFGVNLQRASTRASGSRGMLEVRCSDGIFITQVIGPGEDSDVESRETFKNDASLTLKMLSVERNQCFAFYMEVKRDIKSDFVFFQFVVRFSTAYQADVTRVLTVRLPTTESVSAYLTSVQPEVAAVLIGKRTLLRAKGQSDSVIMQATIDERIKDIAARFGSRLSNSKVYQFPKELSLFPELLFHLRRGPLLGNIVGHEDERSVLRSIFLNAAMDMSFCMVAPRCLMHRESGTFEELPAYDLALQSDTAVVLDHGTDVFIWLGGELASQGGASAAALAACRTLAEELTELRFPAPRILAFKEGSSQARYIVGRLIPANRDPPYEQEARFPQIRSLTSEQRAKLQTSFLSFDEPSFCEWMRSLKVVPPEPS